MMETARAYQDGVGPGIEYMIEALPAIVRKHPDSPEATKAKERLAALDGAKAE